MPEPKTNVELRKVTLEIDYSKIQLRKKGFLKDIRLEYECGFWNGNEHITTYKIWEITYAEGEKKHHLVTSPEIVLGRSGQLLTLRPLERWELNSPKRVLKPPTQEFLDKIKDPVFVPIKQENGEIQMTLRQQKDNPIFFEMPEPFTPEEEKIILSWDWEKLCQQYDFEGMTKDEEVVYALSAQDISFGEDIERKEGVCPRIQGAQSNAIIATITKHGKTYLAKKKAKINGKYFTSVKDSRLVGYSDGNHVYASDVQGLTGPIIIDNAHNMDIGDCKYTLELAETGETSTGKGMQTVNTKVAGPFIVIANPEDTKDPTVLAESITRLYHLFQTQGVSAVGSRFALNVIKVGDRGIVKGTPLKDEDVNKNNAIYEYIIKRVNHIAAEKIFLEDNIQTWLNKPLPDYARTIEEFIEASVNVHRDVKGYWNGHAKGSFRHIRSYALKQAIKDNLKEIYLKNYDIQKILEDAELHVHRICNINIRSFQTLLSIIRTKPIEQWISAEFADLPKYAKGVVIAVLSYVKANQVILSGTPFPLEVTANTYNALPEKEKLYSNYGSLEQIIPQNLEKFNRRLKDFGFHLTRLESDEIAMFIDDVELLRNMGEYIS